MHRDALLLVQVHQEVSAILGGDLKSANARGSSGSSPNKSQVLRIVDVSHVSTMEE